MTDDFLLLWLAKEDSSALGECRGRNLESLIDRGLAEIDRSERGDYARVSLTVAGQQLAQKLGPAPMTAPLEDEGKKLMRSQSQPVLPSNGQTEAEPSAAFTPGPWDWACSVGSSGQLFGRAGVTVLDYAGYENMWLGAYDARVDAANARLIAAAPDLFYALRMAVQRIERPELSPDASVVLERARAAIAKALGPSAQDTSGANDPLRESNNSKPLPSTPRGESD